MTYLQPEAIANLKSLQERTGKDICEQLIELFKNTTPESLEKMRTHLAEADYLSMAREAHTLKSSTGNLGAVLMSEKCHQIEYEISQQKNYDKNLLEGLLQELESSFQPTLEEITKLAA